MASSTTDSMALGTVENRIIEGDSASFQASGAEDDEPQNKKGHNKKSSSPDVKDWKEYQIHDGKDDDNEGDGAFTYAVHNFFGSQDDEADKEYYEYCHYRFRPGGTLLVTEESAESAESSAAVEDTEDDQDFKRLQIRHHLETANSTGLGLWTGAEVLAEYLVRHPQLVEGQRILELGCGVGLCGLVAHALGASSVTLTDGDSVVLRNLQHNLDFNRCPIDSVQGKQLIWGKDSAKDFLQGHTAIDLVMASDCVYMTQSLIPLWETISAVTTHTDKDPAATTPIKFLYVNVSSSQAPLETVLETAANFGFEWQELDPKVVMFQRRQGLDDKENCM